MIDEKQTNETVEKKDGQSSVDHLEAIKALKEKNEALAAEKEAIAAENSRLLNDFINGGSPDVEKKETIREPSEIRKELFGGKEMSNLEVATKALELRKSVMAKGEPDPFLPIGKKITPEQSDIDAANRVAEQLQECIDYADGDSELFTNELQRRTLDVSIRR